MIRRALLCAALVVPVVSMAAPARAADVPYTDPNKAGSITLCDQSGKAVTSGQVATAPFVWSLHSDVAAPAGYDGDGKTATYFAYQPREGVDPGQWSGQALSGATRYTDAQHPTVQLTAADDGLDQMTTSYPPKWDGLLQLRIYLGAPNQSIQRTHYAAIDVKVSSDGKTWTAVDPGSTPCSQGTGVSALTLLQSPPAGAGASASGAGKTAKAPARSPSAASGPVAIQPSSNPSLIPGLQGFGPTPSVHAGIVPSDAVDATVEPSAVPASHAAASRDTSQGFGAQGIALIVFVSLIALAGVVSFVRSRRKPTA